MKYDFFKTLIIVVFLKTVKNRSYWKKVMSMDFTPPSHANETTVLRRP